MVDFCVCQLHVKNLLVLFFFRKKKLRKKELRIKGVT